MSKKFKIALVFTGNIIGAGFATGSELTAFFVRYGKMSIFGLIFACLIFMLVCRIVLLKCVKTGASDFTSYFSNINPYAVKTINFIVTAYLFASLCIMYSAGGAIFYGYGFSRTAGIWSVASVCVFVLCFGANGFVKLNEFLTPLMILGIMLTSVYVFIPVFSYYDALPFVSPVLYTSYNTITAVPVLTAVAEYADCGKTAISASRTACLLLIATAVSLWFMLYYYGDLNAELPVLSLLDGKYSIIYTFILYIAVITTATGSGIGFLNNLGLNGRKYTLILLLPTALAQIAGLDVLVSRLYSFFGGLGLFILLLTLIDGTKYLRNTE